MQGIPFFLLSPRTQKYILRKEQAQAKAHAKHAMERTKNCIEWTPKIKWAKELNIIASTYNPDILFDNIKPTDKVQKIHTLKKGQYIDSPSGKYRFTVNIIHRGKTLDTACGSKTGNVVFDGDVLIPALYENRNGDYGNPWISITPLEILSLRPGTRIAKGHTIIAGLGLGYQLIEVAKKRSVKRITLIEENQELVDWVLPQLHKKYSFLDNKLKEVIVGDARKVIVGITHADVALFDIFTSYGGNALFCSQPHNIGTIWVWGAANLKGDDNWYY
ncbi:MAG: hypothetical protein KAR08_06785 [Candidatus Heimdallarchaeota archaeon]|nr:hypothetical protein [Candidatus Heimdallarchaeota archaeon]